MIRASGHKIMPCLICRAEKGVDHVHVEEKNRTASAG